MKWKKRYLWLAFLLWIAAWIISFVFGGGEVHGNQVSTDISGHYTFSANDLQGLSRWGHPFVNCGMLEEGAEINVSQDAADVIVFSARWKNGHIKINEVRPEPNGTYRWQDGVLLYRTQTSGVGAAVLPGFRTLVRGSRLTKRENGDLLIEYTQTEKGLVLLLIPFIESRTSSSLLRRKFSR